MSGEIYMAAVGALAYEKRLQIISNNLANSNTVGYKQDQGQFKIFNLNDLQVGPIQNGVELDSSQADMFWSQFNVYTDHSAGSLKNTGNDLDLLWSVKVFSVFKHQTASTIPVKVILRSVRMVFS